MRNVFVFVYVYYYFVRDSDSYESRRTFVKVMDECQVSHFKIKLIIE